MNELSRAARDALGTYRGGLERPAADDDALWAEIEDSIANDAEPATYAEASAATLGWGHRLRWAAVGAAAAAAALWIGLSVGGISLVGANAAVQPEAAAYEAQSRDGEQQVDRAPESADHRGANRVPAASVPPPGRASAEPLPAAAAPADPVPTPKPKRTRPAPRTEEAPASPSPTPATSAGTLAEELKLMQQARRALDGGKPLAALQRLTEHGRRFANGQLREDRAALRVVALCASENVRQGTLEAKAFGRTFPKSHHAARVQAACKKDAGE